MDKKKLYYIFFCEDGETYKRILPSEMAKLINISNAVSEYDCANKIFRYREIKWYQKEYVRYYFLLSLSSIRRYIKSHEGKRIVRTIAKMLMWVAGTIITILLSIYCHSKGWL